MSRTEEQTLRAAEATPVAARTNKREHTPARVIKLLAVVEATSINAVAKSMLEFCRTARDLNLNAHGSPVIETSLVTFDRRRGEAETPNDFVEAARELGIEVDVIKERARFDPRVLPALREIIKRRAPHIVLTHQVKSHFLMKLSGLWRQVAWAAFNHGYTTTDLKVRAYNYLDRWSLPTAHRVITVCEAFARELKRKGVAPEKIFVQHNSIRRAAETGAQEKTEAAQALRRRLGVEEDEKLVLAIGRLSREKGHVDLLDAFGLLQRSYPQLKTRLLIVGDGPERGALEAAASSNGIGERVIFAGQLSDVSAYYAAADVMALPSHSEGSPYVLLEAMAEALPVVATSVGGVPEMVEDGVSALLVAAREPQAMADALYRILSDKALAQGLTAAASALVATRYAPETHLNSLLNIYRQTISGAPLKP